MLERRCGGGLCGGRLLLDSLALVEDRRGCIVDNILGEGTTLKNLVANKERETVMKEYPSDTARAVQQEAQELMDDLNYFGTHPRQIWEYERAHYLTFAPFEKWWWDCCYREARTRHHERRSGQNLSAQYMEFVADAKDRF